MAEICGQCTRLDWNNKEKWSSVDKYWCKNGHGYRNPNERKCSYDFCYNPASNHTPTTGYTPSGCPITNIICNILGYDDNCELLKLFRMLRENVLKLDFKYYNLLLQYNQIGPEISTKLMHRKDKYQLAVNVTQNFLLPIMFNIKEQFIDNAVHIYKNMLNYLSDILDVELTIPPLNAEYDINTLGKARI